MELLYILNDLGFVFSIWYVSFIWHSLLVFTGLSLVLFGYRKYSARIKFLVWFISLPLMFVLPILSNIALDSNMPVHEIDLEIGVLETYGKTVSTSNDNTSSDRSDGVEPLPDPQQIVSDPRTYWLYSVIIGNVIQGELVERHGSDQGKRYPHNYKNQEGIPESRIKNTPLSDAPNSYLT